LVELLWHPNPAVQTPVLKTACKLMTGDDEHIQKVLDASFLEAAAKLLDHDKNIIRKYD